MQNFKEMERKEAEETKTVEAEEVREKTEEEQVLEMMDELDKTCNRKSVTAIAVIAVVPAVIIIAIIIIAVLVFSGKKNQPETVSIGNVEQQEATTKEVEEVVVTPSPTVEPTTEPTPEPTPITYEGIDMESTLPGTQWVETFVGVIEEPKFVVFNDETNKKVIVENEQEVKFEEGDMLIAFQPEGKALLNFEGTNVKEFKDFFDEEIHYLEVIFMEGAPTTPNDISVDIFAYTGQYFGKLTCRLVN